MSKRFLSITLALLALILTACGQSTPEMIASYPSSPANQPKLINNPAQIVYNAYIELEVANVDTAAERAQGQAYNYGGYLVSSQSWSQDGKKYTTLVLAVPVPSFDRLREALLKLGTLKNESVTGELVSYGYGGQPNYSQITLHLKPRASGWPTVSIRGWDPGATISQAFEVFITIFGFLVDVLLWLVIVIGPFALIGWGGWALARRLRR
jgi:hypothetical protein